MKLINCLNCGAPLHNGKCLYCGSEYNGSLISVDINDYAGTGNVTVNGTKYNVYLSHLETELHEIDPIEGRDINGRLIRDNSFRKRVFHLSLVET